MISGRLCSKLRGSPVVTRASCAQLCLDVYYEMSIQCCPGFQRSQVRRHGRSIVTRRLLPSWLLWRSFSKPFKDGLGFVVVNGFPESQQTSQEKNTASSESVWGISTFDATRCGLATLDSSRERRPLLQRSCSYYKK